MKGEIETVRTESKTYIGVRTRTGCQVKTPARESLPLRLDLRNHSPTGFEWGYGGSGPAQLALALLAHCMGDEIALQYYQDFKWKIVAILPREGWTLTLQQITKTISALAESGK